MMHLKKWILNIIRSGQLRYLHNKVLFFQKPLFVTSYGMITIVLHYKVYGGGARDVFGFNMFVCT